jgi:type VI secretion system secreted protein Hcp
MNVNRSRSARKAIQVVLATGVAVGASQAAVADDVFLTIPGLPGESVDSKHKDAIDVLSFSQSVEGRQCPLIRVAKRVDKASPGLAEAASSQRVFASATLIVRRTGDKAGQEYYTMTMSSVQVLASNQTVSGEGSPYEEVMISPRSVTMAYRVQKPDGSLGETVTSKIDNCLAAGSPSQGGGGPR